MSRKKKPKKNTPEFMRSGWEPTFSTPEKPAKQRVIIQGFGGGGGGGPAVQSKPQVVEVSTEALEKGIPVVVGEGKGGIIDQLVEAAGGKLSLENVRALITQECRELEALLHEKNAAYGNSALDPVRLFSKASPVEQLLVRIDDKISRISRGDFTKVRHEDLKVTVKDMLGYLILIRVAWRLGLV